MPKIPAPSNTATIAMPVLRTPGLSHCCNDLSQPVVSASFPRLKNDLTLSFSQIRAITLVYQSAASVFPPVIGYLFARRPASRSLPIGMCFSFTRSITPAFVSAIPWILISIFLVGIGVAGIASAVLGQTADNYGIEAVYNFCGYIPPLGLDTYFLPDLNRQKR